MESSVQIMHNGFCKHGTCTAAAIAFFQRLRPKRDGFFKAVYNANVISDEILCQNLYFKPILKEFLKILTKHHLN
jgi:hypothetical protein